MPNSATGISFEMLLRYAQALEQHAGLVVLLVFGSVAASIPHVRARAALPNWAGPLVLAAAVLGGVAWGWHLAWLGDDAFISFRYADNLAKGHGLVFNPGERVEGYTNFLWTLLLSGFIAVGADPGQVAMVLSLLSFAALIALVPRLLRQVQSSAPVAVISVAALVTAAQYTLGSYATSGLETMFAALLAAVAVLLALHGALLFAGAAGIAATLAHPDHSILYASLGLAILLDPKRRRGLLRYALPFIVVYLPYFAWRWNYYGEFFPNTYYAKSADLTYFEQGWVYVASFAIGSGLWLSAPLVAFGLWRTRNTLFGRYLLVAIPLFVLYIAKIGGDFMYGRLFCPLIVPLLVVAEVGWRALLREGRPVFAAAGLSALVLVAVPTVIFEPGEKEWHISDERTFYPVESFSPLVVRSRYFRSARVLNEHFTEHGSAPLLGLECVGTVGYYTGLPIVDSLGITDSTVAHSALGKRGRPGHEKIAQPSTSPIGRCIRSRIRPFRACAWGVSSTTSRATTRSWSRRCVIGKTSSLRISRITSMQRVYSRPPHTATFALRATRGSTKCSTSRNRQIPSLVQRWCGSYSKPEDPPCVPVKRRVLFPKISNALIAPRPLPRFASRRTGVMQPTSHGGRGSSEKRSIRNALGPRAVRYPREG